MVQSWVFTLLPACRACLLAGGLCLALQTPVLAEASPFAEGVRIYRTGQYAEALPIFEQHHQRTPEDVRATYYLALTQAQLGRFSQAKALYEEILLLAPQSEAAQLARQGLEYLPATAAENLDPPPRFQEKGVAQAQPTPTASDTLSPQELQALQMMFSNGSPGMGGMGGGMMNPWGGFPQPPGGAVNGLPGGGATLDPSALSTMMTQSLLQQFNLGGSGGGFSQDGGMGQ